MYIKYDTFCIINRLAIIEYYRHCGYESSVMQFIFRVNIEILREFQFLRERKIYVVVYYSLLTFA